MLNQSGRLLTQMDLLGVLALCSLCQLEKGRQGCSRLFPPWAARDKPVWAVLSTWPSGLGPQGASWAEGVTQVCPTSGCLARERLWLVYFPWAVSWVAFETTSPLCYAGRCLCSCSSRSWSLGITGAKCRSCSQVGGWGMWVMQREKVSSVGVAGMTQGMKDGLVGP